MAVGSLEKIRSDISFDKQYSFESSQNPKMPGAYAQSKDNLSEI